MTYKTSARTFMFSLLAAAPLFANAQATPQSQVEAAEAAFWQAYNACDHATIASRLAGDVEFYHDMGGALKGKDSLGAAVRNNICGNPQEKTRRQAGESQVFLLKQGAQVYGALVSGTHTFHIKRGTAAEATEGKARYSHVWLQKSPGTWELSRAVSYDHQPFGAAPATAAAKSALTAAQIERYVGEFTGQGMPPLAFSRAGNDLTVAFEGKNLVLHPLDKPHTFLVKENNAEVEFKADASGPATALVVRMNGNPIGEAKRK
ncbi:nuclear transport factor 2 family protein [Pseudoduganella sp. SL102]|uniref:nuclear transport factor 2 family protein n=1 Tax=Pseudoduganella sp. SL102 TaxID=2995154 RepID=UPI00248BFD30|nr:nuclear transport factor 2 family protein [Pseudoduganella sp. SL102]WBS04891.1 nuclear transport factor 2 family protein [Pseudoduganella sp. SL102]